MEKRLLLALAVAVGFILGGSTVYVVRGHDPVSYSKGYLAGYTDGSQRGEFTGTLPP